MKARDAERLATVRMALSALNYRRIERHAPLSEDDELDILRKQVKQRDDAIELYRRGGREELAAKEERERAILMEYLPQALSADELRGRVESLLAGLAPDVRFGDAMKAVMPQLKDQANGKAIQEAVKAALAQKGASR